MDILSNLKYADGSIKKRKRIGRGQGRGHGGTSTKEATAKNLVPVINIGHGSKVVKCHCKEGCRSEALIIFLEFIISQLMWINFKS